MFVINRFTRYYTIHVGVHDSDTERCQILVKSCHVVCVFDGTRDLFEF